MVDETRGAGAYPYQPFYCEENIWRYCVEAAGQPEGVTRHAIFITNKRRTVACWAQRACPVPGEPVVWDYHVVLAERHKNDITIHDPDCTAGTRLPALAWVAATFPTPDAVRSQFQPLFRVVTASTLLAHFASDRSHMRAPDGAWLKPIPPWPAPGAPNHNLEAWLDVGPGGHGFVCDLAGLVRFLSVETPGDRVDQ